MRTVEITEPLSGGWRRVRRALAEGPLLEPRCPNCGSTDPDAFKPHAPGSPPTLDGFICVRCEVAE